MTEKYGNSGSRTHRWGMEAKQAVGSARRTLASGLAASPEELIFTSGATESNNLALLGLAHYGEANKRRHIVSCATEHKSVLQPLEHLAQRGFEIELLRPSTGGRLSADEVLEHVRPDTLLVSLMHVNNETGVVHPVAEIAERLRETATYFHVDAAQGFAKLPSDITAPIDLISFSGHKIGAPKGIGGLLLRRRRWEKPPLQPIMFGGGQERGLRPGTLPVELIVGLALAARLAEDNHTSWLAECRRIKESLLGALSPLSPVVNGDQAHAAPNILNVSFPGQDAEALVLKWQDQVAVSTGSACTSATFTPSHVLSGMGLPEERIQSAVRFSWGLDDPGAMQGLSSLAQGLSD